MAAQPESLTIRSYQVGFGDCFLLTFHYAAPTGDRHVLIDFGSNAQPKSAPQNLLVKIAQDIALETNKKLHAIVLSHRHKDHIAGFATASGKGPGDIIASLKPDVIVQPWTEDPDAAPDATEPTSTLKGIAGFVRNLAEMQKISGGIAAEAARLRATEPSKARAEFFRALEFLGEEGVSNLSAVKNLQKMGKRHAYVSHGSVSGMESLLPGVRITVLGPPTLKQSSEIRKERSSDANEFWMLQARSSVRAGTGQVLFPRSKVFPSQQFPPYARWFVPRMRRLRAQSLLQMVRVLDDAMNNTSIILLFEIGREVLLFPGDAQIEDWNYTLQKTDLMKRLARVTFYKVGHHGSRNATPKSLWKVFKNRNPDPTPSRLKTAVSTLADKYGRIAEGTEVPRETLVKALKAESDYFSTQQLKGALKKVWRLQLAP